MFALVQAYYIESYYKVAEIIMISKDQKKLEDLAKQKNEIEQKENEFSETLFCIVEVNEDIEFNLVSILRDNQIYFVF